MRIAQRGEHALRRAWHTDQAGAFQVEQGQVGTERQAFHRTHRIALGGDAGTRMFRMEGVADDDGQSAFHGRRHGLRMHDLGAEVRQFAGLVVAQRAQLYRLWDHARVGGQHAIDVGPDVQFGRVVQRCEDRAGIIAAVAAQGGEAPLAVARDEAGGHHAPLRVRVPPRREPPRAVLPVHHHAQFAMIDAQHLARIQHGAVLALQRQVFAEQARRTHFAQALDALQHQLRQAADDDQRVEDLLELLEALVHPLDHRPGRFTQQRHRRTAMTGAQRMPAFVPFRPVGGGQLAQFDQRIGDALHGRHHGDLHVLVARQQQLGHVAIAFGIGDGGAAELVDDGAGFGLFDFGAAGRHGSGTSVRRPGTHQESGWPCILIRVRGRGLRITRTRPAAPDESGW